MATTRVLPGGVVATTRRGCWYYPQGVWVLPAGGANTARRGCGYYPQDDRLQGGTTTRTCVSCERDVQLRGPPEVRDSEQRKYEIVL